MEDIINNIVEKISFTKKKDFAFLLNKCIQQYVRKEEEDKEEQRQYKSIIFKIDYFFKNFSPFINEKGHDKKYEAGVEALSLITEELKIEIDKSECFILFHLRKQGKFKIKESKLLIELKNIWPHYKQYALESQDFSAALRNLRDERAIKYRKGNLMIPASIIIRYR